jgi:hypothetical protein
MKTAKKVIYFEYHPFSSKYFLFCLQMKAAIKSGIFRIAYPLNMSLNNPQNSEMKIL